MEFINQSKEKAKFIKNNAGATNAYINPEQKEFNDLDRFYANWKLFNKPIDFT